MTARKFSAEDKIRIVLEGIRGETGVRELCRREGIATNFYDSWSKEFLDAGKKRLVAIPNARPIRAMCLNSAAQQAAQRGESAQAAGRRALTQEPRA